MGDEALAMYSEQKSPEYIVLANDGPEAITTDLRPERCVLSDYYVFPKNLAWTMAFTHEEGWLGPYFAKHPDYDKLIKEHNEIEKNSNPDCSGAEGGGGIECGVLGARAVPQPPVPQAVTTIRTRRGLCEHDPNGPHR